MSFAGGSGEAASLSRGGDAAPIADGLNYCRRDGADEGSEALARALGVLGEAGEVSGEMVGELADQVGQET